MCILTKPKYLRHYQKKGFSGTSGSETSEDTTNFVTNFTTLDSFETDLSVFVLVCPVFL